MICWPIIDEPGGYQASLNTHIVCMSTEQELGQDVELMKSENEKLPFVNGKVVILRVEQSKKKADNI